MHGKPNQPQRSAAKGRGQRAVEALAWSWTAIWENDLRKKTGLSPIEMAKMTPAQIQLAYDLGKRGRERVVAVPSSPAGMKQLLTPVRPETHKRLKMLAAEQGMTLEAVTRAALELFLLRQERAVDPRIRAIAQQT
jgi:hypothetical protein